MNTEDKKRFNDVMVQTADLYDKKLSAGVMRIYWESLQPYGIDEVSQAISSCLTNPDNGEFMPKPANIIRMLEGSNQNKAAIAWSKVMEAIGRVGPYRDVVFDDPIIHRAISDMGGWINICGMTDDDAPFRGNEFEKRYQGYSSRNIIPDHANVLQGISNTHNHAEGFRLRQPLIVGDRDKAMLVFHDGKDTPLLQIVDKS